MARGAVRISSVSLSGKQVTLTYAEPGTWFGDIALFDGLPRTHDADAHGATTLLVVRKPDFKDLLAQHVELYDALLRLNCRRLRLMFDQFEDLNTRPLQARLAKQILLLARSYGIAQGEEIRIGLALAQEDLAQLLGASRQRVNQELKGFEREGAVRVEPTRLVVLSRDKLLAIAERRLRPAWSTTPAPSPSPAATPSTRRRWKRTCRRELPGFAGPLTVEQFKGGQSNPTYKLVDARARLRHAQQARAGGQAAAFGACGRPRVPRHEGAGRQRRAGGADAPAVHDEAVIGRAFYVMEFVDGRVLWDQSLPGMTPAERGAIYDEMNRVIAALHSVDVQAAGLADYGKPGNYFERQIGRWSKQYLASVTEPIDEMDRLIEWLPAHMPASARDEAQATVVHGDFRLDNLVFHTTEPRIIAVLDWELSTLGHPLADFSYHCMAWHIPPGTFRGIGGLDHAALGIPSERDYVRRYCERVGQRTGRGSTPTRDGRLELLPRLQPVPAGRRSRRASPSAWSTAPPPASRPAPPAPPPAPWRRWPGTSPRPRADRTPQGDRRWTSAIHPAPRNCRRA